MEQNNQEKQVRTKKSNAGLYLVALLLIAIIMISSSIGLYAWARYTSSQGGNATAEIAKWSFDLKLKNGSAAETTETINLADTISYTHVKSGTIAPGTSGQFQIIVNTTGTEVDCQYDVTIALENCPKNITFTRTDDSNPAVTTELSAGGASNELTRTLTFSKYLHAKGTDGNENGRHVETITWNWPYEADANETAENKIAWDNRDNADSGLQTTMRITARGTEMKPASASETTLEIGDSVSYTTTLNGQTLSNWSVFYVDGDYTYIILDDYLPNADISSTIQSTHDLSTYETYSIYANNSREDLISAMTTKSNWDSLLTGTINGHAVNETRTANVWAMGAPTIDLWVNSWNASYSTDTLYTRYVDTEDIDDDNFYATGYAIGDSANPTTTYIDLSGKTGYGDTLYFPHQEGIDNCYGYWLASPSAYNDSVVMGVSYYGYVNYSDCSSYDDAYAFRPVVCLPSSVVNQ